MRFTLTLLAWIVMVGGLSLYIQIREAALPTEPASVVATTAAEGQYALVLTSTFSVEADPFALQIGDTPLQAVTLRVNGELLTVDESAIRRGASYRIEPLGSLVEGQNEIYLEASPPALESHLTHGIRVQLFRDQDLMVDRSIWGEKGALVSGSVPFSITATKGDDHDQ